MASGNHVSMVRYLYKSILRLHKGMPVEFRALGDQYTREEFKRHKNCEKAEADKFMLEWTVSQARQGSGSMLGVNCWPQANKKNP